MEDKDKLIGKLKQPQSENSMRLFNALTRIAEIKRSISFNSHQTSLKIFATTLQEQRINKNTVKWCSKLL